MKHLDNECFVVLQTAGFLPVASGAISFSEVSFVLPVPNEIHFSQTSLKVNLL